MFFLIRREAFPQKKKQHTQITTLLFNDVIYNYHNMFAIKILKFILNSNGDLEKSFVILITTTPISLRHRPQYRLKE